eukprot:TRINITY_DN74713_c0_g1_i1.p1 TRINITY_DN74713_c0_g1~~TRINITY_DN74713_c0_g1_i1.p1  ORF type:complete len:126 (+),score=27.71 TRINITY_DN74713_c0_g1_i1:379-756(+)
MRHEELWQRRAVRYEAKLERLSRQALAKEDVLSARWRGSAFWEDSVLEPLLQKLARMHDREDCLEQKRQRQKNMQIRSKQQDKAKEHRREKLEQMRRERHEREKHWRWLNRKDLTMDDIATGKKM